MNTFIVLDICAHTPYMLDSVTLQVTLGSVFGVLLGIAAAVVVVIILAIFFKKKGKHYLNKMYISQLILTIIMTT